MKNRLRAWLPATGTFAVFSVLSWRLPWGLPLSGTVVTVLRVALLVLGAVAAVLVLLYVRARMAKEPEVAGGAEIDEAVSAAEARLASSNLAVDSRIGRLPVALVLGPTGSTKTSIVVHSGLDPELLAGEVQRGDAVMATDPVNIWYAHGAVVVEAGGRMLEDAARWRRLLGHLQPRRFAAALGRGRQAPRFAVLCFACDDFVKPGAAQNLHSMARQLRARLSEAAQQLGIRLPVYVLFTRADRLPFFADYVRSLTSEEAQQVVGATLPLAPVSAGTWAERESRRLNEAFGRIVHALAVRRLELLPREEEEQTRAGAYEFPRELSKIVEPAVQLLLDVFRPSQLGVTPLLRGFYFTGVRPIIIRDAGAEPAPPSQAAAAMASGATSVFNAALLQQALRQVASTAGGGGRKVPQWVFLPRLFRDVILRDDVALNLTGGGTRVDLLRRSLIGAAAAACLILVAGFTTSYAKNRSMIVHSAAAALFAGDARTASSEHLVQLDSLRRAAAHVGSIDRSRTRLSYRWGLYRGDAVHAHLLQLYFDRFQPALWGDTRQAIEEHLRSLPREPDQDSNFGRTQDAFAAYMLTTRRNDLSTAADLATPLLDNWRRPDTPPEQIELASRQFEFFATELPYRKPYPDDVADDELVARVQDFLLNFGSDVYYAALISTLNRHRAVRFEGPYDHVSNPRTVRGAFTLEGLRDFQAALDSVEFIFDRYAWLYGNRVPANKPQPRELATRYYAEYVAEWQDYLRQARVAAGGNFSAASTGLAALAMPQSPLFNMLRVASFNTNMPVDHPVGRGFQPLHALVDPQAQPYNVTAAVQPYTEALTRLAGQARAAGVPNAAPDPMVSVEVRTVASSLTSPATADVEAAQTAAQLRRLLMQPAEQFDRMAAGAPRDMINAAGADFCREYATLQNKLPFNWQSRESAAPGEVGRVFQANGQLATFWADHLQDRLTETGGRRAGRGPVTGAFERFFTTAVAFREALYPGGASALVEIYFSFEPPPGARVRLEVDDVTRDFSGTVRGSESIRWQAERGRVARIVVDYGNEQVVVAQGSGPYGLFAMFYEASSWSGSGPYDVEWPIRGRSQTLIGRISMSPALRRVLERGSLDPLRRCVSTVVNQ
jgi:type VI secretion system protein ImpL